MESTAIERVSVLGLGTMGHGIAQAFAVAGCSVRCYDTLHATRESAVERIRDNLQKASLAGIIEADHIGAAVSRVTICDSEQEALTAAQFVTEAISEELADKQQLFSRIESFVDDTCILASNTSTFPMTQIAVDMNHPQRAIDTHWFNPPHIVPLVEVIAGEKTSEQTTQTTLELLERIGKMAVRLNKELPGFLVNRVQIAMLREILDLLERGVATAEDIDRAIRGSIGFRLAAIGPLLVYDFAGIDINSRVYKHLVQDIRSDRDVHGIIEKLVADGHLGVKTGQGLYDYTPESVEQLHAMRDRRFLELIKLFYSR